MRISGGLKRCRSRFHHAKVFQIPFSASAGLSRFRMAGFSNPAARTSGVLHDAQLTSAREETPVRSKDVCQKVGPTWVTAEHTVSRTSSSFVIATVADEAFRTGTL